MSDLYPIQSDDTIINKIYLIRDKKVMLDRDLADLYDIKPIRLREQVKRNPDRFPENFMFQLSEDEVERMVSQNAIPSRQYLGGHLPYVFTEHGVLMLSNVLKSERAIKMSIRIIEIFVRMRELLMTHRDIFNKLDELEIKYLEHDEKLLTLFEYIKEFEKLKQAEIELNNRPMIGFKA